MIMAFLFSPLGRLALGIVAVGLFLSAFAYDQRSKGAASVIAASQDQGRKINDENAKIHADAERPGAAERVRLRWCRDCEQRRAVP